MTEKILLPLAVEHEGELIKLLHDTIKSNKGKYQSEIEKLNLEKELTQYFYIFHLNDRFLKGIIQSNAKLPEWLNNFLNDCYFFAQNSITQKYKQ